MGIGRFFEVVALGLRNLLRNKLRSFLTMLGIIFGVASVIAMLSVGAGAKNEILSKIQELGVRNIIVNSTKPPAEIKAEASDEDSIFRYGLTYADADYIETVLPTVEAILRVNRIKQRVWYGSKRIGASVLGVSPTYLRMFDLKAGRGRTFTDLDEQKFAKVCIVRRGLIDQLETVEDPVGLWLQIGGYPFQVIGILEDEAFRSHTRKALNIDSATQEIYIPYATSIRTLGTITDTSGAGSEERTQVELDQIVVTVRNENEVLQTSKMLDAALARLHEKRDYDVVVPMELLAQKEETQRVFNLVMILIASISLLVGGIGIANIMLATITERTKEIGIRRALGARRRDIILQFLAETTSIAAIGGVFGCLLGIGGIMGIVELTSWKAVIEPGYVILSLVISCSVGIIFGIFPARRAAQMDPITALRFE
ncbi:MAG: putative ABC transport system permease protein [Planctomycetota bacterium]|jgi:putative ABC transport system permease protein